MIDERSAALVATEEVVIGQFRQRLSNGHAAYSELLAQFEFRGNLIAWLEFAALDPLFQDLLELSIERHAAVLCDRAI